MQEGCPTALELFDYEVGNLKGPERDGIEAHLKQCGRCRERVEAGEALDGAVRQAVREAIPPQALERLSSSRLARTRSVDG